MSNLYKLDVPNSPRTPAFDLVDQVSCVTVTHGTVATLVKWIPGTGEPDYPGEAHLMLPDGQVIETYAIAHPEQVLPSGFIMAWQPLEV